MSSAPYRREHDLLGERLVPGSAYYGVHTVRAFENFPIIGTSISIYPDLVVALACVKQAAALANNELKLLDVKNRRNHASVCRHTQRRATRGIRDRRHPGRR